MVSESAQSCHGLHKHSLPSRVHMQAENRAQRAALPTPADSQVQWLLGTGAGWGTWAGEGDGWGTWAGEGDGWGTWAGDGRGLWSSFCRQERQPIQIGQQSTVAGKVAVRLCTVQTAVHRSCSAVFCAGCVAYGDWAPHDAGPPSPYQPALG